MFEMNALVLSTNKYNFTADDGNNIRGASAYLCYGGGDEFVTGYQPVKVNITEDLANKLASAGLPAVVKFKANVDSRRGTVKPYDIVASKYLELSL